MYLLIVGLKIINVLYTNDDHDFHGIDIQPIENTRRMSTAIIMG